MARGNMAKDHVESSHRAWSRQQRKKLRKNRASPARLIKLYKYQSAQQQNIIRLSQFGGLVLIACGYIPANLSYVSKKATNYWDSPAPECNVMKFVEGNSQPSEGDSIDRLPYDEYKKWEQNEINLHYMKKAGLEGSKTPNVQGDQGPTGGQSSVQAISATPAHVLAPRRNKRKGQMLKSPFFDGQSKTQMQRYANKAYAAVCSC
ncbi:hypothetical protein BS78_05G124100 [Paspalum vaginatum]|nr:hypothetical protein BS78_05G124100 [Paspalum vaginatum]